MPKIRLLFAGMMALVISNALQADVLSITDPQYTVPNSPKGVLRPKEGMSMAKVEQKFGKPEKIIPAVGEPPITRWIYKDFVVYFERNLVIHSVVQRPQPQK